MKKKVLLISSGSGSKGGGEIYLIRLAEVYEALGYEPILLVPFSVRMDYFYLRIPSRFKKYRYEISNIYDSILRSLSVFLKFCEIARLSLFLRRQEVDLLHLNQQNVEDGLHILLAAYFSGKAYLSTVHVTQTPGMLGARFGNLRAWISRVLLSACARTVLCVSRLDSNRLQFWLGGDSSSCRVFPVYTGRSLDRTFLLPSGETQMRLLNVARLEHQKDPLYFLDIVENLCRISDSFVTATWVGDGSLRPVFEAEVLRRGLSDNVRVTGWVDNVEEYYVTHDIFLMTSRFEGLPLALQEAMSYGLLVATTAVDGIAEIIVDSQNGIVFQKDCSLIAAERISLVVKNDLDVQRMRRSAFSFFLENFTTEAMANRMDAILSMDSILE